MIYDTDPYLSPYRGQIDRRYRELVIRKQELAGYGRRIADAVNNHLYYGVHADRKEVVFREWAPNATAMYVIGDFNGWQKNAEYRMNPVGGGGASRLSVQMDSGMERRQRREASGIRCTLRPGPGDEDFLRPGMAPSQEIPLEAHPFRPA